MKRTTLESLEKRAAPMKKHEEGEGNAENDGKEEEDEEEAEAAAEAVAAEDEESATNFSKPANIL